MGSNRIPAFATISLIPGTSLATTGNPLFPYFNEYWKSPLALAAPYRDMRFLPTHFWIAAGFPILFSLNWSIADDIPFRDIRVMLAYVTGIVGEIASHQIFDATLHYRWAKTGLTFRLTGKNVLDTTYIIARRPEGIFPGPFRQLIAGLRWEWENMKKE